MLENEKAALKPRGELCKQLYEDGKTLTKLLCNRYQTQGHCIGLIFDEIVIHKTKVCRALMKLWFLRYINAKVMIPYPVEFTNTEPKFKCHYPLRSENVT